MDALLKQFGEQNVVGFILVLARVSPLFVLAPMLAFTPALLTFSVIPMASPLDKMYRTNATVGWNIGGMSIFVLLALGVLSFLLNGVAAVTARGPAPQAARFAVWIFMAALAIANALVVREGTVKYHVKNILRKLGATSRADAVARFVRSTSSEGSR